jgi:MFS family permease
MGAPSGNRPSLRKAMVVFEFKYYRYLWISSAFSFTGMQMQQVARALLAWQLTHSYGAVGMVSLAFGLPMLLFSLIGGAMSDRMEKRNLVLATQIVNGVLAMGTATAIVTGQMTIELLFVLGLLQGTGFALGMPARTPLMADAVGAKNVMSAIAMSNAAMNATRLIGPALAGLMVALWGIESAYFAQATFNSLSALVMLLVPTGLAAASGHRPSVGGVARGNMFVEIGRGLKYVATEPRLRLLMGMMFVVSLFAMPYVMLLAGYVQEDLGQSESAYGWLQSVSGIGAIVASVAVAAFTEFDRKPLVQWVTGVLGGLSLIMLALGSEIAGYPGAIVAVVMLGLWLTAYQTLNNTMLMDEADPSYYGRVMSVNMLTFSVMPLMAVPLGALADLIGASQIFAIMGGVVVAFMLFTAVINPGYTFGRQATREQRGDAFGDEDASESAAIEDARPGMLRGPQGFPTDGEPAGAGAGGGGGGA